MNTTAFTADLTGILTRYVAPGEPAARRVDWLQYHLAQLPQLDLPLVHRFTPGLYVREIFMPTGAIVLSRVHKTRHPFVVSKGRAAVWSEETGVVELAAPHTGITEPGTQRLLIILDDCIWTTFHPTKETDLAKLQDELTSTPDVSYIASLAAPLQEVLRCHEPEGIAP